MLIAIMSAFLLGAVICDLVSHRLPNLYLLSGLLGAIVIHAWLAGWDGISIGFAGLLTGFALFVPFYILGGMAAGDVKLLAVVGFFLGSTGVIWAGAYSLVVGAVFGIVYLLYKRQFVRLLSRYWAMASLRTYIPAEENDAARQRFPYAIAIFTGTLISLFWQPFGQ